MRNIQSQEEADQYWAGREYKKWVVTLSTGPVRKPVTETKYVGATTRASAIETAKRNAFKVLRPSRIACRLATAIDLGCVRSPA